MEMPVSSVNKIGHIDVQSGVAFKLDKGQEFKVISPLGEQVSDLFAVCANDLTDVYSSAKTLDYAETIHVTEGHTLYSLNDTPLLEIIEDKNAQNDCLLAPCSPATFKHFYNQDDGRIGCMGNLRNTMAKFGVFPQMINSSFNIFMNVQVGTDGAIKVLPPKSKPGDYVKFKALEDLIIGLTACSAEQSNNYSFKPIEYIIY